MPDLGNLMTSPLSHCTNRKLSTDSDDHSGSLYSNSVKTLTEDEGWGYDWEQRLRFPAAEKDDIRTTNSNIFEIQVISRGCESEEEESVDQSENFPECESLNDFAKVYAEKKLKLGLPHNRCTLPFLVGAPRLVECLICHRFVYSGEEVSCSVRGCNGVYHSSCAKERLGFSSSRKFKCPQHACFMCKQKFYWRCVRCPIASHDKCAPWQDKVIHIQNQPGRAVCWRHEADWRLENKHAAPTSDLEEVFCRLPLPYAAEDFKLDISWKDATPTDLEPRPYVHIRRNIYLVKKKRDESDDVGCTNCSSECGEDCVCRVQCISCSKACNCSLSCTNRPFRKEKKIKVVKTEHCGWGVQASETINKGDFIIEYVGEVIDDALCEQRLWDMKFSGEKNFYMCEIRRDFTIDATFKGNSSRFLNHSCDPNCKLEKWQVEGETRVGVFAARSIEVGEPLTYHYRFVPFGPEVKCFCGASNCQGNLGTKRKVVLPGSLDICWGLKRKRSTPPYVAVVTT